MSIKHWSNQLPLNYMPNAKVQGTAPFISIIYPSLNLGSSESSFLYLRNKLKSIELAFLRLVWLC
jgi:hypothetical protein